MASHCLCLSRLSLCICPLFSLGFIRHTSKKTQTHTQNIHQHTHTKKNNSETILADGERGDCAVFERVTDRDTETVRPEVKTVNTHTQETHRHTKHTHTHTHTQNAQKQTNTTHKHKNRTKQNTQTQTQTPDTHTPCCRSAS